MTVSLQARDWLHFVETEYLGDFVREGGSTVKFVVPSEPALRSLLTAELDRLATNHGYLVAHVNAGETKLNLIEQLFFQVAQQIPWDRLVWDFLSQLAQKEGYRIPQALEDSFAQEAAALNGLDKEFMSMALRPLIRNALWRHIRLVKEFRIAMTQLCLARLVGGDQGLATSQIIRDWLTGANRAVSAVKPYLITSGVGRHNARHLFESLTHWIRMAGLSGLVVIVNADRLTLASNPRDGYFHYAKGALLDTYEVFRQFIDSLDHLEGFFMAIVPDREFLNDEPGSRGVGAYEALKFRVFDEVRDRRQANPLAALVRMTGETAEGPTA